MRGVLIDRIAGRHEDGALGSGRRPAPALRRSRRWNLGSRQHGRVKPTDVGAKLGAFVLPADTSPLQVRVDRPPLGRQIPR